MSKKPEDIRKKGMEYMKYAGLAFQMAVIFFIGIYGGQKLDAYLGNEKPIATIILVFVLFIGYMYKLFNELK